MGGGGGGRDRKLGASSGGLASAAHMRRGVGAPAGGWPVDFEFC